MPLQHSLKDHFLELKTRFLRIFLLFIFAFIVSYYFSDFIYDILLKPLANVSEFSNRKVIYTSLTEAFFTYLKLSAFVSFLIILPAFAIETYLFIKPGLIENERKIALFILALSPILFFVGTVFVFYYVMPRAWVFFLSFENPASLIPIVLEAKISEYLGLVMQLVIAFGAAFQLPIILLILNLLGLIKVENLKNKRRLAIVVNFIIAGILTPPDVISQFALALPLLLLYEISIIMCNLVENRGKNVGC